MRSKIIFPLALVMGIITTILFFSYIKPFHSEEVIQQKTIEVVKAKERIAENQIISSDLLEVVTVTEENIHPQAVRSIADVEGKYTDGVIEQGEILIAPRFKDQQEEKVYVSRKVKDGYRAVSVEANIVETVTNLMEPGDYVDVAVTFVKGDKVETEKIFSGVLVLAVGRKMDAPVNDESTYTEYNAVTLELKPNEAVKLINAHEKGNIHFTLHPSTIPPGEEE
ncbi:Flp pilus assembly protein CpaB [Oceanobacillus salinisoli]|uniref:Flp pilus assembly protein CpaB n=1 Tax=Oceanobacillus salinisoli TaxID=2678611 RepID=UPI0012E1EA23|nr:Flp pilus assembly protein CpaB [Oceanobacillus salinisoli]